jgi:hypothetical protein
MVFMKSPSQPNQGKPGRQLLGFLGHRAQGKQEAKARRCLVYDQRKLAALDELKKSLLHQAFSGEL